MITKPVYPIPPSFIHDELDLDSTIKYLSYLDSKGSTRVLTTAGTSQFNLLDLDEVYKLNKCLVDNFPKEKILGLPALSLKHLLNEIEKLNRLEAKDTSILILFSERYYNDDQLIKFFETVCYTSNYPVYLHGNSLRKGFGGTFEYSNAILRSLSKLDNFVGMKEEYSSLDLAIKNIQDLNLDIIVAGGSMRRFWTLLPFGATSFLTGIGSFNPTHAELFYQNCKDGNFEKCIQIIQEYETPAFNTFMSIGWHASMRQALKYQGFICNNREPFVSLNEDQKNKVNNTLQLVL